VSRIGRKPIEVPSGVTVTIAPGRVEVKGPLGTLSQVVPQRMKIEQEEGQVIVTRPTDRGDDRALHGLTRTLVANMVEGVEKAFPSSSRFRASATARRSRGKTSSSPSVSRTLS